jgi:hypothetical protein
VSISIGLQVIYPARQNLRNVGSDGSATFQLPRPFKIGLFALVMSAPCGNLLIDLYFGLDVGHGLIDVTAQGLFWALVYVFLLPHYTVRIRSDGVKLYGLWWLPWADVSGVRYRKVIGLPYFHVKRGRGFSWWIPLYFVGDCNLGHAIIDAAPPGSPFRLASIPS